MSQNRAWLGMRGEAVAEAWLRRKGYEILDRNWRSGHLELDLVARKDDTLVIVEVKTRREKPGQESERPDEAVQYLKQRRLGMAAKAYMGALPDCLYLRFDIIAIRVYGSRCRLYHQEDAFFPGL